MANLKTCCLTCNNERGNRSLTSWLTTLKWKEQMYKGVHRYRAEAMVANVEHWLEYVQENKQKMRTVGINKVKNLSNFKDGLNVYPLGHLY